MRYGKNDLKPSREAFECLADKDYCLPGTVLRVYRDGFPAGSFKTIPGLIRYLEDDVLDYWSLNSPDLLGLAPGDFEKYLTTQVKKFLRTPHKTFYGLEIRLEFSNKETRGRALD